ncbi:MAG: Type 1 glutamine amidotransferase-like domain-containing protein, partial [Steroidobacter sp.]
QKSDGDFVYGGYSAGSCVLAPSLKGIEVVDPPELVPTGYEPEVIWDGLGVLSYCIAPHFDSEHPESLLIDDVVDYFERHGISYRTLRDGEAIILDE